jgi:predicted enzyme related to lactoylglutathione lyase
MEKAEQHPTLNGLVETALFVEDLPQASAFYGQVLGLGKSGGKRCKLRLPRR